MAKAKVTLECGMQLTIDHDETMQWATGSKAPHSWIMPKSCPGVAFPLRQVACIEPVDEPQQKTITKKAAKD